MEKTSLEKLFSPKSIAIVGATSKPGHVGTSLIQNLIGSGFEGTVYPVNPKHNSILGVKAYPSVASIPEQIDVAVIAIPAGDILQVVEECGTKGVSGLVIISSGFDEIGESGIILSKKILESAKKYGMRILGPNCLGYLRPKLNLNVSFANQKIVSGNIAFISQSGALGTAILDWAYKHKIGLSYFVSIGSMLDIGFSDLIDYFGSDPNTSSILIYMESLKDARKFLSAARAFARTKPIIILKVGKSTEGAAAAKSHTGSLTGNDMVFDAAFKRAGVLRVDSIGELFDSAKTIVMQPKLRGNKLAIVTNAGGPGVIATDSLIERGGVLAHMSEATIRELDRLMPKNWSRNNPVDILGDADTKRYSDAINICLADDNVDAVLAILTPQAMTDPVGVAKEIISIAKKTHKVIMASWMGEDSVAEAHELLYKENIPVYHIPENAIRSFINMWHYKKNIELLYETPATIPSKFTPDTQKNKELIKRVISENRYVMMEHESKELLRNYKIPTAKYVVATSASDALEKVKNIGYPVVMKVLSPDIIHKTDAGCVRIGINNDAELKLAFDDMIKNAKQNIPHARLSGVIIEELVKKKYELLIGCKKDPIFGPTIVFGKGGIDVEVYKDISVGLPPLNMALARRLMEETKVYTLLKGYRNIPAANIEFISFILYKFAYLVMDFPEIKEIDINPFAVDNEGGVILDAKVILDGAAVKSKLEPYHHMVISPYPKEYQTAYVMKDGTKVLLRPIKPEDEPMEAEMFSHFSEETQRFRFFQRIKDISHEMLIRYTQIDYDREIAIIAEIDENGEKKMAGVARLIADPYNENAEFAIVVADPWQSQGLGNALTDYLLDIARKRGIKKVLANVLKDNNIMLKIFRNRNFIISDSEGIMHAELVLS